MIKNLNLNGWIITYKQKTQNKYILKPYLLLDRSKTSSEASAWRHDDINKNLQYKNKW